MIFPHSWDYDIIVTVMNLHTLDLNFQNVSQTIASYLIIGPDGPVLVETGPGSTLSALLAELAGHGFAPADIRHVFVTHIHLDHAGAAGWWAQQGAQVYVHPFGAPHLIDPTRLLKSATRIYGDKMDTLWGDFLPAPADKVTAVVDGDIIEAAGLRFEVMESPGHARHHHVYLLEDVAFTGDAAGIQIPAAPFFVDVPAPPPEFELEVWLETLDKLAARDLRTIYPTHFGAVTAVAPHLETLRQLLGETAVFIKRLMDNGHDRGEILSQYYDWNRSRARQLGISDPAIHQYETANPWYMSVDGIMRYWQKKEG
jgi:glyoxylase-like metal-dependent hydrolase (beta-lactamase superfamily II)